MVNNPEILEEVLQNINKHFSNPKNVKKFKKIMNKEMKKPVNTHLQCNIIYCKYNRPKNPDMGTITYCKKYKNNQEELCNKECGNREWYELQLYEEGDK